MNDALAERTGPRVLEAAYEALLTPFADLSGRFRDAAPAASDFPALAAAAIAVPALVAAASRGMVGLFAAGPVFGFCLAAAAALSCAVMACAAVAVVWFFEGAAERLGLPREGWGRGYAYGTAQLCTFSLAGTWLSVPLTYLVVVALAVGGIRRARPYTVSNIVPATLPGFLGITAAYLGAAMYFGSGVPGLIVAILGAVLGLAPSA